MELCTFDLLEVLTKATESEFNVPRFYIGNDTKEKQEARYSFVFYAFNKLNARPTLIRRFLPCYKYPKTVYQVMRREYMRRKDTEHQTNQKCLEMAFKEKLKTYYSFEPKRRVAGEQIKLFS